MADFSLQSLMSSEVLIPLVGLLACSLAFWIGWRLLSPTSGSTSAEIPDEREFLKGVTLERRATLRRKGNTVEVLLTHGNDQPPVSAWVIDRSQGGLCLLVEQPIEPKTSMKVRPRAAGEQGLWIDITVCSCRSDGAQYELGCQFHKTPNWNQLLQFG
jgi:hypothetical protein